MGKIIGQDKLIKDLYSYNVDTFPHSTILCGQKGSGKHLISNFIANDILKLPLNDITDTISFETIDNIYRNPNPAVYLINISEIVEKEQNSLLKFIEEPLKSAFIILLCDNLNVLLNTVINRCVVFEIQDYTKDQLKYFIPNDVQDKDLVLEIIKTPGKILNTNLYNIKELFDLCDKIINKISLASYSNTLSIANKINYKNNYDKFDLDLFFDAFIFKLRNKYFESTDKIFYEMYLLTADSRKRLIDKRLNKELFFQNFITKLWKLCKEKVSL